MHDVVELHATGKGNDWHSSTQPASPSSGGVDNGAPYSEGMKVQDSADMRRMGKKQEFRRNFNVISISSFCLAVMMGFVFIPINGSFAIAAAGTGGAIVLFICNFFGLLTVVLGLAEMSSIAPTAGGQYHWVSEFSPPGWQKFLSYYSGWLSALAWLVGAASSTYLPGSVIPSVAALAHPGYTPQPWHSYLVIVGVTALVYTINRYLVKYLPLLEGFIAAYSIVIFLSLIITLCVLSPKLTAAEVFQTFEPLQGNGTLIMGVMSSQILLVFSLFGWDSTVHMAEETANAAKVVPKAMVTAYCTMGVLSFVTLCVYCACFVDYSVLDSAQPWLSVFVNSTGSAKGAIALASIMIICIFASDLNFFAATSRQIFAFARDDGFPLRRWIAHVDPHSGTPQNALIIVAAFVILISLIGLGSSVAFQAIISLGTLALAFTYELSTVCLIWRRLYGAPLPAHPWSLGKLGLPINIFASLYGLYLMFFSVIPSGYPVTAVNFNWAPVMFAAVMIFATVHYVLSARKVYKGPVVICQPVYM